MRSQDDLRKIPQFGGKYLISRGGRVYRVQKKNTRTLKEVSTTGGRVRFYFNGIESRPLVVTILADVWGPDAAENYEERMVHDG